jgi:hypothetical protein
VHNLVLARALFLFEFEMLAAESARFHRIGGANFIELRPSRPLFRIGLPVCRGHRYDPGAGSYFFIPDDDDHLKLTAGLAS